MNSAAGINKKIDVWWIKEIEIPTDPDFDYTRYGEIDIIAKENEMLVFVEVKMRTGSKYGIGAEAVTAKKIEKIQICARLYLQENSLGNQDLRFDVIDIMGSDQKRINHIKAAF